MTTASRNTALRVAIYVRISSDPTGRAAGVERQEKDCRALARQLGWKVVEVRSDNDVSAYSGKSRPGYRKLLDDIRAERIDAVLAWHPDRLYRRLPDLEELAKAVQEHKVVIRTVRAGVVDLNTASGLMTAEILASVSKHEVMHSIERITAAKADAAAEGRYRGGPRPYGFESDGVTPRALVCPQCGSTRGFSVDRECAKCGTAAVNVVNSEAWHVEQAIDAVVAGESLRSICATLAERGALSAGRRKKQADGTRGDVEQTEIKPTELRRILLRPRNSALIELHGDVAGRAQWPAIVDEEKWRAAKGVLENPARRTTTTSARRWLGSGLYGCFCGEKARASSAGVGGTKKVVGSGKSHKPVYRCSTGRHIVRDVYALDEYVEGLAVERLSRPDATELLLPPAPKEQRKENLAADANALRAKLDSIAADYAADLLTRKQALDATAFTRARLEAVNAKMADRAVSSVLSTLPLGTPEIAELWPGYHLDKKRAIIDALMVVTIHPARRGRRPGFKPGSGETYFDAGTIEIKWKRQAER